MKALHVIALSLLSVSSQSVLAGDLTTDAAIGGAIGGALGAAVGAELGGRDGALIGAGVGAAVGAAVTTGNDEARSAQREEAPRPEYPVKYRDQRSKGNFCPPGQAKKGHC